jgi:hypothetical protein
VNASFIIGSAQGLTDRSRRPYRHASQLPLVVEQSIVRLKREYPNWGAFAAAVSYAAWTSAGIANLASSSGESIVSTWTVSSV